MNKYIKNTVLGTFIITPLFLSGNTMIFKEDSNLRKEANLKSDIVKVYKKNETIEVLKKIYTKNNGTWYETKDGFVSIELLKEKEIIIEPKIVQNNTPKTEPIIEEKIQIVEIKEESKIKIEKDEIKQPLLKVEPISTINKKDSFITVSLGYSNLNIKKKDIQGSIVIDTPKDDANSINIQYGRFLDNYTLSMNYAYDKLDDLDIHSLYGSIDYIFPYKLKPYIGVSFGLLEGKWNKDIMNVSQSTDKKMNSFLYGIQSGFIYKINDTIDLLTQVSYQRFELDTLLISNPAKSEISIDDKKSISLGLRYSF